jgi:hypothetical protein
MGALLELKHMYIIWHCRQISFEKLLLSSRTFFCCLFQPSYLSFAWVIISTVYCGPIHIIYKTPFLVWPSQIDWSSKPLSQVATYGKGFVQASQDTWQLFVRQGMESIVDSDITSSICFLTGVCSGSICVIVVAAWTARVHQTFTATLSLLSFFIGYLMVGSSYLTNSILYLLDLVLRSCDQLGHSIIYTEESFFNQEVD